MDAIEPTVRAIAFYLPQYHPIPENDLWWGKGFTEWTNVTKSAPRFQGHYQPHLPADLGFYDLRLPEARRAQADLAREYGIHGFCYYHYWFNGKRLLERPLNEVLKSAEPDFPFCLCWANENWTRVWDGQDKHVLLAQGYSAEDDIEHIKSLISVFSDRRYIRIHGKPVFLVYRSSLLPDPRATIERWREQAVKEGLGELFLCRVESTIHDEGDPKELGFDAAVEFHPVCRTVGKPVVTNRLWYLRRRREPVVYSRLLYLMRRLGLNIPDHEITRLFDYDQYVSQFINQPSPGYLRFPCVCPSWDNSARREHATIIHNSSPQIYNRWLENAIEHTPNIGDERPIVFINAWNEWAEGNHLEPCQKWGRAYLEATRVALFSSRPSVRAGLPGQ
jgi:lipopolysaccharide biosynthesis protein